MEENRVFSFSVKTKEDQQLVEAIKIANAKQGRKFSWVVLEALKQYQQGAKTNEAR